MQALEKTLRNKLERTVMEARDVAEVAARAAVEQLGVGEPKPYAHLSADEKELRRKLRIHGRQLGDFRHDKKDIQEIDRLVEEIAYEHWHRMLFARFLAENNLLMYPDPDDPVAVSLEECEDLAAEEGAKNGWELASRFAARMLPQIFRPDSPVFQLVLPPEYEQKLERLLADLPQEVFHASDSLGWVYQFWQAKRKDAVNASEVKIGARELPAVTQLFTEPYMVAFLLDNSLGAWWAARRLSETDLKTAKDENDLRRKVSLPGMPLEYLRFVKGEDSKWSPAAGTFDGWPEKLAELKTLDPCCGSGHFLVAAFLMLVPMRMERDGLSAREAVDRVLAENIHGLEIDQRCVELAAFALALAAWRYPDAGGYRQLPELNVACSGLSISAKKEEWLALAGDNTNLRIGLEELYKQFEDAPVLGSLINPEASLGKDSLFELEWEEVGPLLARALAKEKSDDMVEMSVVAHGLSKSASLLSAQFNLLMTNVPYLGREKQSDVMRRLAETRYERAKHDLATMFVSRIVDLLADHGMAALVLPQYWLFLSRYKQLRKELLRNRMWEVLVTLGPGAFETISGEVVNTCLVGLSRAEPEDGYEITWLEASTAVGTAGKAECLMHGDVQRIQQAAQLKNPDAIIGYVSDGKTPLLSKYAYCYQGLATSDNAQFVFNFWEVPSGRRGWHRFHFAPSETKLVSGCSHIIFYEDGEGRYYRHAIALKREGRLGGWKSGHEAWGKRGVAINRMGDLPVSLYLGEKFDCNVAMMIPNDEADLPALWAYCSSLEYPKEVRRINKKLSVTNATLAKVPFDRTRWRAAAQERFPDGLPEIESDDPAQWVFHGRIHPSTSPLHVAVCRLLGYRWPEQVEDGLADFIDDDGIVCLPAVRGEESAAVRLQRILAHAFGNEWSAHKQAELLTAVGCKSWMLERWLNERFFQQHCNLFEHRPFIWQVWDGIKRGGFSALVNYHKLDRKNLETLIYTYLGDWITRQKQDKANGVEGAEEKLLAALALQKRLELILKGEEPYDIFVRWKPAEEQPLGWDPDLDDGVRLNIRPFMLAGDVGRKGAGILRDKPNVHWKKDRGKGTPDDPWHDLFGSDRINDHHVSIAEKTASRNRVGDPL